MHDQRHELDTGSLRLDELKAIMESMPADVTFADAENVLRFYTGRYRIFDRTPDVIGTSMIDCHSPASRDGVERLVAELRDGWRDEATFLEEKNGRPVHVRYLPVREGDRYLGVLEIAQWADEIEA
jgi:DUF438 domain-containing protein